ncbi:sugar phosphate nucleotidyltransferase [Paenibacillus pasadenensis]|uniref:sugar phosphate nucleotidyltransferase n=1 Tax=Paenibacillus pasadenensis TaxID=217090 RepID=UPI00204257A1|nr:sugar phosphate nucleotidyltransferase [Paenibacillus pasadenensis]MCM3747764.1 sugar phosphate nucleotidyltransferase [Paenibacillus pasadenensis]
MRIILMSGGSGKRLWPLSNDIRSKLFLKLLPGPDGTRESMMQRLCRQLSEANLLDGAIIVTHDSQAEITLAHAGSGVPIVKEPEKRGTFMAAALGAAYLSGPGGAEPDETVCLLPVDLFVQPDFFELLRRLPEALDQGADLAMIGTEPTYPSSQYGYIVPGRTRRRGSQAKRSMGGNGDAAAARGWTAVERFAEKPDPPMAARLMKQGALWNCGVFAFRLGWLLGQLEGKGCPSQMGRLSELYAELADRSFDQEIAEQTERRMVLRYSGEWHDLGSWSTFLRQLGDVQLGPGSVSGEASNTHLINELDSPIHIIGLPDAIVAASPDGILVASKEKSDWIKGVLSGERRPPMQEEKRWGSSRTLELASLESGEEIAVRRIVIHAGKCTSYHLHQHKGEIWTVISGSGQFMLEDEIDVIAPGDVMRFPAGSRHGVKAAAELHCMLVEIGRLPVGGKDIERLLMSW